MLEFPARLGCIPSNPRSRSRIQGRDAYPEVCHRRKIVCALHLAFIPSSKKGPRVRLPGGTRSCGGCKHSNATCAHVRSRFAFLPERYPKQHCRDESL